MLRRPPNAISPKGKTGQQTAHSGLQTFSPLQMMHMRDQDTCVPNTVQFVPGQQTRMTHQQPLKDRSFAAAAAAASRARCEYPIFIHHQPHRDLKASSKCARQASPLLPPATPQQPPGSGCEWTRNEGQFEDCHRSSLEMRVHSVSTVAATEQRYHEVSTGARQALHRMSPIDELCPSRGTGFGARLSDRHMEAWNHTGSARTVNPSKQTQSSLGTRLRNVRKDTHGLHDAGVQETARDTIERLAFAG